MNDQICSCKKTNSVFAYFNIYIVKFTINDKIMVMVNVYISVNVNLNHNVIVFNYFVFPMVCLLIVLVWLSVSVQVIDSCTKWHMMY